MSDYVDQAVGHVLLRKGVLGIKVKIMLPWDPSAKIGLIKRPLPDHVSILDPKDQPAPEYSVQCTVNRNEPIRQQTSQ